MKFDQQHYVPCLRWKMGEYQAVLHLSSKARGLITPLINVPEIGFDFKMRRAAKSIDDHLAPFATRVRRKWGATPCFIDMKLIEPSERMANGQHPAKFVFDDLRSHGCVATPVTGLDRDPSCRTAVRQAAVKDKRGVCLRIGLEEANEPSLKKSVIGLLEDVGLSANKCDLVLDLGALPNFEPIEGFAKLIQEIIRNLPYLPLWQTFTLVGTSFPQSMAGIRKGPSFIKRSEWSLYKVIAVSLSKHKVRVPTFGDYAINHPDLLEMDMRLVKPSATIRYTVDDAWLIIKGKNVRDHKFEQYRKLCRKVRSSSYYFGSEFSHGDKYIADCAAGNASTGNLTTWRKVGTNHHLEKVVSDISSFFDSSDKS